MIQSFSTPRGRPVVMHLRIGTNDHNTLYSCLTEDEYGLKDLHLSGWALDVGAYIGGVTVALAVDNPDLRVLAVEPVPDNVSLLMDNLLENGCTDRVPVVEGAAGPPGESRLTVHYGYRGEEHLEHHAYVGNTTLADEYGGEAEHDTLDVPAYGLGFLLDQYGIDELALLKIDCEGGEWAFLADPAIVRAQRIVGEWHPTKGHVLGDMLALLDATHEVVFTGPQSGPGGFSAVRR